jgi:hypothetical protein
MPDSVSPITAVATGYAPLGRYLAYFALTPPPRVFQNSYNVWKKEGKPQYTVNGLKVYKWPKTQLSRRVVSLRRYIIPPFQVTLETMKKDLRNWTKVRSRRGTNYKEQSKMLHQSHFEPEGRSCRQQTSSNRIHGSKGEFGKDINRNDDKELNQRLITQNKEQQNTIDELSSAVKVFL